MEASHDGRFDDSGERDRFGKILPNCQFNAKKLNTWKPAMMADLAILANATNLAKFCQSQCKEAKHIEASHDGRFDDFSKRDCQTAKSMQRSLTHESQP